LALGAEPAAEPLLVLADSPGVVLAGVAASPECEPAAALV
jgi:hypothetical protein